MDGAIERIGFKALVPGPNSRNLESSIGLKYNDILSVSHVR